jgi:hypothetical protein
MLTGTVAWLAAGMMFFAQRRPERVASTPFAPKLGAVEGLTLLLAVDGLFALFAAVQSACLFGGRLPVHGITYAEYARRGFFELLTVAVLSLVLLSAAQRLVKLETAGVRALFRGAGAAQVALVLLMLLGAVTRLQMYEEAYGYTEERLLAHALMPVLAALLVFRGVTLFWRPQRFGPAVLAAGLLYLALLNALNPEAQVARLNLARYAQTGTVDADYLATLGPDARPDLDDALPRLPERAAERLRNVPRPAPGGWAGWNLARARAEACH